MKKLKKLTAVLTAAAMFAGGNISVLPERLMWLCRTSVRYMRI